MADQAIAKGDGAIVHVEARPIIPVHRRQLARFYLRNVWLPPVRTERLLSGRGRQRHSHDQNRLLLAGGTARPNAQRIEPTTRREPNQVRETRLPTLAAPPLIDRIDGLVGRGARIESRLDLRQRLVNPTRYAKPGFRRS